MTVLFLLLLAMAWAAVFVPAVIRARQQAPVSSTERFKRGMGVLATPQRNKGRWIIAPGTRDTARRRRIARRRRLFMALSFAAGGTFLLAMLRSSLWDLHLLADAALVSYVVVLVALKRQEQEVREKVSYIEHLDEDRSVEAARAVGDLEFQEPPSSLLEPYDTLDPAGDVEDFEFYEAVHAGGRNG